MMHKQLRKYSTLSLAAACSLALVACNSANDDPEASGPETSTVTSTSPTQSTDSSSAEAASDEDSASASDDNNSPEKKETDKDSGNNAADNPATENKSRMLGTPSLDEKRQWDGSISNLVPVDIRVGHHKGFDRAVIEFEGTGKPMWIARLNNDPRELGSGFSVDYKGNTTITLNVEGTPAPIDEPIQEKWLEFKSYPGTGVISEVQLVGAFEAASLFTIGLDKDRPFSVTTLTNPTRIVVDIESD